MRYYTTAEYRCSNGDVTITGGDWEGYATASEAAEQMAEMLAQIEDEGYMVLSSRTYQE